jgi:hypothetical protein
MVAHVEALDERQTPVQWALSEAVRDFILHSRAVGKGQPRSYDDPQRNDKGDETEKAGAIGIPNTEIPFPHTTNDVVTKQLRELIAQGLVDIKGEGEPPHSLHRTGTILRSYRGVATLTREMVPGGRPSSLNRIHGGGLSPYVLCGRYVLCG